MSSPMASKKTQCWVQHFSPSNPIQQYGLGEERLLSLAEMDLEVLVDSWLSMSQQWAQVAKKANNIRLNQKQCGQQG